MLELLLAGAAAQLVDPAAFVDPPAGPMPVESRTLSQPHANHSDAMFPDLTVRDLRIEGDTLHVLVANVGGVPAEGSIRLTAEASAGGVISEADPERIDRLMPKESQWVVLGGFSGARFALADASLVSVTVSQPPAMPAALDRTGQLRNRFVPEANEANNSLTLAGSAIVRANP